MKLTTLFVAGALLAVQSMAAVDRAGAAVVRKVDGTSVTGALVALEDGVLNVVDETDGSIRHAVRLEDVLDVTGLTGGGGAATAPAPGVATAPARPARPTMRIVKPAAKPAAGGTPPDGAATPVPQPATQPAAATATQPAAPTSYEVELAGGGRLRGKVEAWSEQHLRLAPALLEGTVIDIPLPHVRAVWAGAVGRIAEAKAMRAAAATVGSGAADPAVADVAYVLRDDKVHAVPGVALGIDGDALRFRYDGQDRRIALGRLVGVAFADQDEPTEAAAFHQTLAFAGGGDERLPGTWTSLTDDASTLGLRTLWGQPLTVPAAKVTTIAFKNGRLVYLSDLTPAAVEQVPYFDRVIPFRTDTSLTGTPLRLSDGPTTRGVAVHARCVLHYDLGGTFDTFRSRVGFQQPEGKAGRADVRVLGDGKVLYEKLDARGDQPPADVEVSVAAVKRLTLEVDFGPEGDVADRVVWGDAKLMRPTVATVQAAVR